MKKILLWFILFGFLLASCELEQIPVSTTSKSAVFGSASGLQLYAYSF
jgi:hypothetical protein